MTGAYHDGNLTEKPRIPMELLRFSNAVDQVKSDVVNAGLRSGVLIDFAAHEWALCLLFTESPAYLFFANAFKILEPLVGLRSMGIVAGRGVRGKRLHA